MRRSFFALLPLLVLTLLSCATDPAFNRDEVSKNDEFSKIVKIEQITPPKDEPAAEAKSPVTAAIEVKNETKKEPKKGGSKAKSTSLTLPPSQPVETTVPAPVDEKAEEKKDTVQKGRSPKLEDNENFNGRRPLIDPFTIGEEIVLGVSYFAVEAGKFKMEIMPMVEVNGKKSYHYRYTIKSSPLFSMFYSVNDIAETFVDYETLLPYSYEVHVDESKQVRETRTYFDQKNLKATMWDKKQKRGEKVENRKIEWNLMEYPQNVFSVAYYLRNFTLKVGKKLKVNVGHEGKNIVMTAEVLRKEKLYTKLGAFDTFVIKPQFDVEGKFKPTGENFLWLTADDRKFVVRLESKIKIGSIVGEIQQLKK